MSYIGTSTTEQRQRKNANSNNNNHSQPELAAAEAAPSAFLPTVAYAAGLASVFVGLGLSVALAGGIFGATTQAGGGGYDDGTTVSIGKLLLAALSSGVSVAMGLQLLESVTVPLPSFEVDVDTLMRGSNTKENKNMDNKKAAEQAQAQGGGNACAACSQIAFDDDGNLVAAGATGTGTSSTADASGASGSLFRTFLLGGSSALIASPCATPVLTSILAYVATSRDPIAGAILLLAYTLGYSTPLLVIGATGGQALANAQEAAAGGGGGDGNLSLAANIGRFVTPLTAGVLIWYGTTGFLEAFIGDPSLAALAPILE